MNDMNTVYLHKNHLGIFRWCPFAVPFPTFAQSQGVQNLKSID